jgi:DNA processing protein
MLTHWLWLITRKHVPRRQQLQLLEHFSDPEEIYRCTHFPDEIQCKPKILESLLDKDLTEAGRLVRLCADRRMSILTLQDAAYPARLRRIPEPPVVLFCRGILPDMDGQPAIGVVGTRKASSYGMHNAWQMSGEIAVCGAAVVSGGAAGIDTAALQGALDAQGTVVAVLGCGADVVYPKSNKKLFQNIMEKGCILSEYLPGTGPSPWQFPERNRIISGLSDGVLVVEAPEKSGALITARDAMNQGREIFAVPGNIDMHSYAGSNGLLRDGASVAMSGWDVVRNFASQYPNVKQREFVPQSPDKTPVPQEPERNDDKKDIDNPLPDAYSDCRQEQKDLDDLSQKILSCLDTSPISLDELMARLNMPATEIMQVLTKLTLMGMVKNHPGRLVSAKR